MKQRTELADANQSRLGASPDSRPGRVSSGASGPFAYFMPAFTVDG
jgi:hypothetical protein